jgi:hypothetical protein
MNLQYKKFERDDGDGNVVLFHNGELYSATSDHPNWAGILTGLENDDETVVDLFDVSLVVARKFEQLSERVRVNNGRVYFDGDEVDTVLTRQIVRFLDDGEDFSPLVKFYERLAQNPNQESVDQLYRWLQSHDFTITEDGKIIGYKGVQRNKEGSLESVNKGKALVNGQEFNGHIPNNIGDVVEMPRADVTFDPEETCSYGLHIGTWDYAQRWGRDGAVLKVLVDPRDVVSVPVDASGQKLRACRYAVLDVIESKINETVVASYSDFEDEESYSDECSGQGECGSSFCGCDDDMSDEQIFTDVTKSTVVDTSLPWPQYCESCNGPCMI